VKFENGGARITLPAGVVGERPHTGLATNLHVRGDFEITVNYETLQEPDAADTGKPPTRLLLVATVTPPTADRLVFTRRVDGAGGCQFTTWTGGKGFRVHPAKTKTGRLRVVRNGAMIAFWVAEPADGKFEPLREAPFGNGDLVDIKLLATTGSPKAAFDVRFTDQHVRATELPNVRAVVLDKRVAPDLPPEMALSRGWLAGVLAIGFGLFLPTEKKEAASEGERQRQVRTHGGWYRQNDHKHLAECQERSADDTGGCKSSRRAWR
jgi:hypothetical protein